MTIPQDDNEDMKPDYKVVWDNWETELAELHATLRAKLGDNDMPSSVEIIRAMREERDEQLRNVHANTDRGQDGDQR